MSRYPLVQEEEETSLPAQSYSLFKLFPIGSFWQSWNLKLMFANMLKQIKATLSFCSVHKLWNSREATLTVVKR